MKISNTWTCKNLVISTFLELPMEALTLAFLQKAGSLAHTPDSGQLK